MSTGVKKAVLAGLVLVMLAGCSGAIQRLKPKKGVFFDGHQFRAKASQIGETREEFEVVVRRASQSAEGAREAGRHEAHSYCIRWFGRSDVTWAEGLGPDVEDIGARIADDQLVLRGRCKAWS